MHHPGQWRGLRLGSSGAENEGSERIVVGLAGLLEPSPVAGERDFTGGQLKQRPHLTRRQPRYQVAAASPIERRRLNLRTARHATRNEYPDSAPTFAIRRSDADRRQRAPAARGSLQRAREWFPPVALLTVQQITRRPP